MCGSVYALAGNALLSVVKVSSGISASAREYPPSQPPPHTLACTHALTPGFCPLITPLSQFNQSNNQINQSIYQPSTNSSPEEDFSLNYKALFLLKKKLFCSITEHQLILHRQAILLTSVSSSSLFPVRTAVGLLDVCMRPTVLHSREGHHR